MEDRIQQLTLVLTKELQVSPDKSHKGGLRAARRAVRILNQLDKSSQVHYQYISILPYLIINKFNYRHVIYF